VSANDIIDNVVSTIENDSDYTTWAATIWSEAADASKVDSEEMALSKPGTTELPTSRVYSLDTVPDYDSNTALRGTLTVIIITWLWTKKDRVLSDDLRDAQAYIAKAIMVDETRGSNAWFTNIVSMGEPITDDFPIGYIITELEVIYTVQEAT